MANEGPPVDMLSPPATANAGDSAKRPPRRRFRRLLAILLLLSLSGVGAGLIGRQLWAAHHFRRGRAALERYHSQEASDHLRKCLTVWPHDAETLLLAARAARRLGAFDDAEHLLDTYRTVRGQDDELTLEQILLRAERGDLEAVRAYCQSLLDRQDPATPLVLEALAHGSLRMFQFKQTEDLLGLWLKQDPDNVQALWLQGSLLQTRNKLSDAATSLRRVVQLDSEHDEARLQLCDVLLDLSQAKDALPHLEYLAKRLPDRPQARIALARCLDQLGRTAEAEEELATVVERWPNYAPALVARGRLALRAGRVEDAEVWLRKGCELGPGDVQALYQFHQCLVRRGKAEDAKAVLSRLKQAEEDTQRFTEIITYHLQNAPHDSALHQELGAILLRAGAVDEGMRWLNRALKENPDHRPTHRTLADYYQRTGEFGKAARHRTLAGSPRP